MRIDLDTTALTRPLGHGGRPAVSRGTWIGLGATLVMWTAVMALPLWITSDPGGWPLAGAVLVWAGVGAWIVRSSVRGAHRKQEHIARLVEFARTNQIEFATDVKVPSRVGAIFPEGVAQNSDYRMILRAPRRLEVGHHSYVVPGPHNFAPDWWGYAAATLASGPVLPHLVIRSRAKGRAFSHVPGSPLGNPDFSQVDVALVGAGAEAFTVAGPLGQASRIQDLLDRSLFGPDMLARLTERLVDIEIVDADVILYHHPVVITDPENWHWILDLLSDVAATLEALPGPESC